MKESVYHSKSVKQWKDALRKAAPGRHGLDETGECYICGNTVEPTSVLCLDHQTEFKENIIAIDPNFMLWVFDHKDYNGPRFWETFRPCGGCGQVTILESDLDYLCKECRE